MEERGEFHWGGMEETGGEGKLASISLASGGGGAGQHVWSPPPAESREGTQLPLTLGLAKRTPLPPAAEITLLAVQREFPVLQSEWVSGTVHALGRWGLGPHHHIVVSSVLSLVDGNF